jgi:hypothetical protein
MCRSKAEGGRRCPTGTVSSAAPRPGVRVTGPGPGSNGKPPVSRAEAKARWAQAERTLADAKAAVGPLVGNQSSLLLGPLSQQARTARGGGDPSVYDEQVAEGRKMLSSILVSHGDSPGSAAAKIEALATAYAAWSATPEAR